ncbi:MAG: hypothetical protein LBQ43_02040, partial [Holosporales bacterium]|nr:hypothetical protein [Holosporales bacterium]
MFNKNYVAASFCLVFCGGAINAIGSGQMPSRYEVQQEIGSLQERISQTEMRISELESNLTPTEAWDEQLDYYHAAIKQADENIKIFRSLGDPQAVADNQRDRRTLIMQSKAILDWKLQSYTVENEIVALKSQVQSFQVEINNLREVLA